MKLGIRVGFLLLVGVVLALSPSLAQTQASAPQSANAIRAHSSDMVMIKGATLQMGINPSQLSVFQKVFAVRARQLFEATIPRHSVTIDAFYIDKYLVTNAQFKKFLDANPQWQASRIGKDLHNGNYLKHWNAQGFSSDIADHPVVNVSWYATMAYCQWAGKRLPTEAEFEHAARGGLTALYPWGDQPVDKTRANYAGSDIGTTTPVGRYPANGYGLFDMAGNAWEFMADEWQPYPSNPEKNPVAGGDLFASGDSFLRVKTRRVIRGGSWGGAPINLWVEYRDSHPPTDARDFVGFRCASSDTDKSPK